MSAMGAVSAFLVFKYCIPDCLTVSSRDLRASQCRKNGDRHVRANGKSALERLSGKRLNTLFRTLPVGRFEYKTFFFAFGSSRTDSSNLQRQRLFVRPTCLAVPTFLFPFPSPPPISPYGMYRGARMRVVHRLPWDGIFVSIPGGIPHGMGAGGRVRNGGDRNDGPGLQEGE